MKREDVDRTILLLGVIGVLADDLAHLLDDSENVEARAQVERVQAETEALLSRRFEGEELDRAAILPLAEHAEALGDVLHAFNTIAAFLRDVRERAQGGQ
jgi:hypothetical protein